MRRKGSLRRKRNRKRRRALRRRALRRRAMRTEMRKMSRFQTMTWSTSNSSCIRTSKRHPIVGITMMER
jgi:hypothetical protein